MEGAVKSTGGAKKSIHKIIYDFEKIAKSTKAKTHYKCQT